MMKANKWKDVWDRRKIESINSSNNNILEALIKVDGFDTGMGDYSVNQWLELTKKQVERLNISKIDNVLEVGCGSGAFLYCINKYTNCSITGIDYSEALIDIANKNISGNFSVSEANKIPFSDCQFNIVLSHSVFQYFPSEEYAAQVLQEMYRVLRGSGKICIMDINDKSFEQSYYSDRRSLYKDPDEYDQKYNGYEHLFFEKNKFIELLSRAGFVNIIMFKHDIPEYINSRFRFNITAEKR